MVLVASVVKVRPCSQPCLQRIDVLLGAATFPFQGLYAAINGFCAAVVKGAKPVNLRVSVFLLPSVSLLPLVQLFLLGLGDVVPFVQPVLDAAHRLPFPGILPTRVPNAVAKPFLGPLQRFLGRAAARVVPQPVKGALHPFLGLPNTGVVSRRHVLGPLLPLFLSILSVAQALLGLPQRSLGMGAYPAPVPVPLVVFLRPVQVFLRPVRVGKAVAAVFFYLAFLPLPFPVSLLKLGASP